MATPIIHPSWKATLISPSVDWSGKSCLLFWYSMYGNSQNTLQVLTSTPTWGQLKTVWQHNGNHGPNWFWTNVTINTGYQPFVVSICL